LLDITAGKWYYRNPGGDMDGKWKRIDFPQSLPDSERLQIWLNDGKGNFTEQLLDTGKESHLGAQTADLDADGDLDIVSTAWRNYKYLHHWRNDAIKRVD
jgi:hypothetical protein